LGNNRYQVSNIVFVLLIIVLSVGILLIFQLNNFNSNFVHTQLYNYGLQPNSGWEAEYSHYLQLSYLGIAFTITFSALSAVFKFFEIRTKNNDMHKASVGFMVATIFAVFFSLATYNYLDQFINGKFYNYGLTFNNNWYSSYKLYMLFFFSIQAVIVVLGTISLPLISLETKPAGTAIRYPLTKMTTIPLLIIGSGLIALSLLYDSLISLLAGLGLLFWGSILTYIASGSYIKKQYAEATNIYYLTSLTEMIKPQDTTETIYLPASHPKCQGTPKIYKINKKTLQTQNIQTSLNNDQADGTLTPAPSHALLNLFEKSSQIQNEKPNKHFFEKTLPKVLVEKLDIAESVTVEAVGNKIKIKIHNPVDNEFLAEAAKNVNVLNAVGTPISSALASILANCTEKPVIIQNHTISADGKTVEIDCSIIDGGETTF
jgi:hypothetical protein